MTRESAVVRRIRGRLSKQARYTVVRLVVLRRAEATDVD